MTPDFRNDRGDNGSRNWAGAFTVALVALAGISAIVWGVGLDERRWDKITSGVAVLIVTLLLLSKRIT